MEGRSAQTTVVVVVFINGEMSLLKVSTLFGQSFLFFLNTGVYAKVVIKTFNKLRQTHLIYPLASIRDELESNCPLNELKLAFVPSE